MTNFRNSEMELLQLTQADLLHHIVDRMQRSLELTEILMATAAEVRAFLGTDRVKIYRFGSDGNGEVIAESVLDARLPSLLGLRFPADDIPAYARELFLKARLRSIVDVPAQQIGLSSPPNMITETTPVGDIRYRPVDPCHAEYLTNMGVKSSLVVPIVYQEHLWGLLVSHHSQPRSIAESDLHTVQLVSDQVAVAIAQATLLTQAREQAQRQAMVSRIAALLHAQVKPQLQTVLEAVVKTFQGSGGRLYISANEAAPLAQLYLCGKQPLLDSTDNRPIEQQPIWSESFTPRADSNHNNLWAVSDLYQADALTSLAIAFQPTAIRGLLILPLQYRQQLLGYLSIFRDEIETETLWAGQSDPDRRQSQPRKSFEQWRELKQGQAQTWTAEEIELASDIEYHCAMAIHQHQLYQQVQTLNTDLELQVEERTAQLEQAFATAIVQAQQLTQLTEQQKVLAGVIAKIRASLDLNAVFKATAQEVRQLLNVDRVGVFRFYPKSGFDDGEFVSEDVLPGFKSALETKIHDHCLGEKYAAHYQKGRIQAVADIHNAGLMDCHIQVLSQFQIQANLIVPLLKGEELWGLLCIHQCANPRHWQPTEIELVKQVATQLGVAIQQAELLNQTQAQAAQLTQAFHDLQQTQASLIQTEKMSSLGQLVAGVAHEINNPVNFIYGNLNHASEYTRDLLELLQLYQQYYPHPAAALQERVEEIDLDFLTEDLPKMLSSMKVGADRIRQIVLSLRNFSRLDQAEMKPVNIHEGIDSTLLILQHRLKTKPETSAIQVIKEYGELPLVECYAGQLNQVFMNVLSNAIDALETKVDRRGTAMNTKDVHETSNTPLSSLFIQIHTETLGADRVLIRIADNGLGMSALVKERIFDPFFTTKPVGHGTGLGLSISYQIVVDRHRGAFRCSSQPDQGTEFEIEIPVKQVKSS